MDDQFPQLRWREKRENCAWHRVTLGSPHAPFLPARRRMPAGRFSAGGTVGCFGRVGWRRVAVIDRLFLFRLTTNFRLTDALHHVQAIPADALSLSVTSFDQIHDEHVTMLPARLPSGRRLELSSSASREYRTAQTSMWSNGGPTTCARGRRSGCRLLNFSGAR